ncbi:MAG: adenylate/guanylate cyclase domain-containing protein [Hyphomicrobium sp.]|nr:adenylate/guanylate cyclase domain-containing protein [Hyphomicrobium sp.]
MGTSRIPLLGNESVRKFADRLAQLSAYGTEAYPLNVRRRLKIMNVTAYVIALFTLVYAIQQMFLDFQTWKPVIIINLVMAAVALTVPFLHRYGELVGASVILVSELAGIFLLTSYLGRNSGLHIQYFAAPAAFFVILGLERLKLIVLAVAISFALYLGAWLLFLESAEGFKISDADEAAHHAMAVATTFCVISIVLFYAFRQVEQAEAQTDALLHNILPGTVVNQLKEEPDATIANEFEEASVLFADIKGFVSLAKDLGPARTVALLNTIVRAFDELADRWGVEKIKTIGDAYMAAAGLPVPATNHADRIAGMALDMIDAAARISKEHDIDIALRGGIASGPVLAGVIGAKRLIYDVWGDTVNLASRLENLSRPHAILVSELTQMRLGDSYRLEPNGSIDVKGYGVVHTWFLQGRRTTDSRSAIPANDERETPRSAAAGDAAARSSA